MVVYAQYSIMKPRIQAFIVDLDKTSRWRACLNAGVVNLHEVEASLKWGQNCQDYKIVTKAQLGLLGWQPAVRVTAEWSRVPPLLRSIAGNLNEYIPGAAYLFGFSESYKRNPQRRIRITVALSSPRTVDILLQLPKITLHYNAFRIPVPIPVRRISQSEILQAPSLNILAEAPQILKDSLQGECKVSENQITTFNGVNLAQALPKGCYHILAQDCSEELKFILMAKPSKEEPSKNDINIKLGHYDINMYQQSGSIEMNINGHALSMEQLPYKSFGEPTVEIFKTETGVSLVAPDFGIENINYDQGNVQVRPTLTMKGQLCGICGRNDDETVQEFRRPDGSVAKDAASHIHSWILPSQSCTEGCNLQHTLVKLEDEIYGEKSKCYNVHPVLRCAKQCRATQTVEVPIGFHCLPYDSALDLAEGQKYLDKPEDITEMVEAHTACECESCSS